MKTFGKILVGSSAALITSGTFATAIPAIADAASKPTKITFWHAMTGKYQEALKKQVDAFNSSQSKYEIEATAQGDYSTLNKKILAAAKSKTLPDMAQATYTQVPDYAKDGIVQNMDKQIKGKNGLSKAQLKNIYPGFLEQAKYQGKYYSMPFSASVRVMFYNKAILDKYNLSVPKTWSDVDKMAKVLKKDGIAAVGFDKSFDMEWNSMVRSAGTKLVTEKNKANLNSKNSVAAAKKIINMIKNGEALTAGSDIYGTTNFINNKVALEFSSSAGITATKASAPEGFEWGTAPMPSYKGGSKTQLAGNNLVMTSQAGKKQQKGVMAFIKFLISDKQTTQWAKDTGYLPITKKAKDSKDYKNYLKENPLAKAAADALPGAFADTAFLGYQEFRTDLVTAVDSMITGKKDPKAALDTLQKQTKKILKENK